MKKLFFLMLLPLATQAQKHQLSFLTGPSLNDVGLVDNSGINKDIKPAIGPSVELRYLHSVSKLKIGMGLSVGRPYGKMVLNVSDINGNALGTMTKKLTFGNPSIALSGLAGIEKKAFAVGGRLGFVYNSAPANPANLLDEYQYMGNSYGIVAGAYADYTYFIKNIGLSLGLAPSVQFTYRPAGDGLLESSNYRVFSVPLNAGVHYRF